MSREYLEWDKKLEIGIDLIDQQHRSLVQLLNCTYTALDQEVAASSQVIKELFKELMDYAVHHFESEERFMRENNYEELRSHAIEHVIFKEKVKSLISQWIRQGNQEAAVAISDFLKFWIIDHVRNIDSKLKVFSDEKGKDDNNEQV
jgi:hemerythrin-like metal-binding protein